MKPHIAATLREVLYFNQELRQAPTPKDIIDGLDDGTGKGAIHAHLRELVALGCVTREVSEEEVDGSGRRPGVFRVTGEGRRVLVELSS